MSCLDAKSHSSLASIHSTFNLIGPCNTHANTQSHKSTNIRYTRSDHWHMSYANERCASVSSQEQNKDIAKAKGEAPNKWACDQLKTRNLSAVNVKKGHIDGLTPEPTIRSCDTGQRIPIWTAVNQHKCALSGCRLPHYLESVTFHIVSPVVRTGGRTYGHVTTKIPSTDR